MKTKMVYLTVAVEMDAEADEREVVENCDYFFDSPAIKNTEIQEIFSEDEMKEQQFNAFVASNFA